MASWDEYVACMEAKETVFGQVARDIGTAAFNGAVDQASAFIKAVVSWWDGLDPQVRRGLTWALPVAGAAGAIVFTKLAGVIIDAAGVELLALASVEVAAGLAAIVAGAVVGAFMTASSQCLGQLPEL